MFDLQIVDVVTNRQEQQVVALLRDYFLWLRRRYVAENAILDLHYDSEERQAELADLRGRYGAILLAYVDGVAAGCVMLRASGPGACEMRRMFVRPAFQGKGVARALICRLASIAVARGYHAIRLETGPRQYEAQALYRSLGFKRIAPYADVSGWFADNMLFMEADSGELACARNTKHEHELLAAA